MSENTNNGFPVPEEPITREEQYLSAIAGVTAATEIPPEPLTRVEAYLDKIVKNGGGGGGGGTTNYNALENKPQINGTTLSGNKTSSDLGLQSAVMTGYEEPSATGAIAETDTVLEAMGKLEKKADTNQNNILLEQAKTTGMTEGGSNYITVGGIRVYVSATAPTGARTGDLWIGG